MSICKKKNIKLVKELDLLGTIFSTARRLKRVPSEKLMTWLAWHLINWFHMFSSGHVVPDCVELQFCHKWLHDAAGILRELHLHHYGCKSVLHLQILINYTNKLYFIQWYVTIQVLLLFTPIHSTPIFLHYTFFSTTSFDPANFSPQKCFL